MTSLVGPKTRWLSWWPDMPAATTSLNGSSCQLVFGPTRLVLELNSMVFFQQLRRRFQAHRFQNQGILLLPWALTQAAMERILLSHHPQALRSLGQKMMKSWPTLQMLML